MSLYFIFSVILAEAIPKLGLFISLVGAVSSTALALVFPPIIEMIVCWHNNISFVTIAKDVVIILIGVLGFATGTYESVTSIIRSFSTWDSRGSKQKYASYKYNPLSGSLSWTRARGLNETHHDTHSNFHARKEIYTPRKSKFCVLVDDNIHVAVNRIQYYIYIYIYICMYR